MKDLKASLDYLAGRGRPAGAREVVAKALAATTVAPDGGTVPTMAVPPAEAVARPRRWPRRLLIGVNILLAVCIIGVGSGYAYLRYRFGQIDRIAIPIIGKSIGGSGAIHEDVPGEPMNVLLVGSDSRADLTGADCKRNCRDENGNLVTGQRSDTIMILHVDPQTKKAAILSIPRDLWVTIAGTTRHQRINSAFDGKTPAEGAARLIQTVTQNLGIRVNHFVQMDFVGFRNMVNAVDGVKIWVPAPARDFYSDLRIPNPGCVSLTGDQALAWVRSRHYQYYESGRWRSDGTSDFGRITRQQDFIRRLMKKAISKGIRNPLTLNRMIGIAVENVSVDSSMSTKDILGLGKRFRSLDPNSVAMYTLPTTQATIGGADVLRIKEPDADQIIAAFNGASAEGTGGEPAGAAAPNILPSTVRVRTLNGSGLTGQAGKVAGALSATGFQNAGTGDADSYRYATTEIHYGRGQVDKARLVQAYLKGVGTLKEDRALSVDVQLIVGRDYTGVQKPAAGTPAAPTTTVPAAPTTTAPLTPVPIPKGATPPADC